VTDWYNIIMRKNVLGVPVDLVTKQQSLEWIAGLMNKKVKMKLVVTAYSEFYVRAQTDSDFMKVMREADLIVPDGVSVLAAVKYKDRVRGMSVFGKLVEGLKVGGEILSGKVGKSVTGVWLFENLTKMAAKKGWKIFLLGGWENVSGRSAEMLLERFPKLKVEYDAGEERVGTDAVTNKRVIEKINNFAPDILFVSYNPIKQEKWLMKYRNVLKAKIGIGVGGTFDEYSGKIKKSPRWMEKMGLKWLWRVFVEPKRFGRIMKAVIVFPWLVFRSK
jgi:N-acetylglucosaminyldiphosphoundecaprenol N-acetyl-beta-D-mannosaminyltransferase